jgi:hypothetical protein
MSKYYGITHALPLWLLPLWKKTMCKRNMHVFDEVVSSNGDTCDGDHYLACDACDLVVNIASIDTTYIGWRNNE